MIQRIQSIFLLAAAIGFALLFKLPFATSNTRESPFFDDQAFSASDHPVLIGLVVIGILVCAISIFQFNNRPLQIRMGYVASIVALFTGIVAVWLVYSNAAQWSEALKIEDGAGIYSSIAALICVILAIYFIGKDEKTVRSMDRLR